MQLPAAFIQSLESLRGFDKEAFINIHESGEQVTSVRLNPAKKIGRRDGVINPDNYGHIPLPMGERVPWTEFGFYLNSRPSFTFDPLFHAGCYYVQEASSMFLEQALKQTVDLSEPIKVLDLCAAPGGKSTHLLSLISKESLLVSNEVIRSRAHVLNDNIVKWGNSNVMVTNNDPRDFNALENYFDVIVVDAPCSGSGLFRKDPDAIQEWSEQNVALCNQRQQRILADVMPALKSGGTLIYSTCSYSREEDEEIAEWLFREWPMEKCELNISPQWNIISTEGGYRFWPDKIKGEGFFITCFKKTEPDSEIKANKLRLEKFTSQEADLLMHYVKNEGLYFFRQDKWVHAAPEAVLAEMNFISAKLRVLNAGIRIGEIIRGKLVPDHALAMSTMVGDNVPVIEIDYPQAIRYLKKKELSVDAPKKGWCRLAFQGHTLGWVNVLPGRINNYYPKELRILKD
jgi:16S rRNA C967 or C1407 C5-methylase (RsmB/RsmF family)/NOL1/NOP2/fmu family ribosome biogenesis protein